MTSHCGFADATARTADGSAAWAVFDIDGTVSDCRHRQGLLDQEPPDWEAFFASSHGDQPLPEGVGLALAYARRNRLLWLTGRPERYRGITVAWLEQHGLPSADLHMRPDGDMRPAAIFKAERILQLAADRPIVLIVDDDDRVVAALRSAGWPVRHAVWMQA
jgi:hypothetical protein